MSRAEIRLFLWSRQSRGKSGHEERVGGKGANLAEMSKVGVPVPAGFTITTEMCTVYYAKNGFKFPKELIEPRSRRSPEEGRGESWGRNTAIRKNPLLVSVRSGARQSMPGMMDTVLNVGLCSATLPGLIEQTGDERFAYDAYRRLITMYADVVMEKATGIESEGWRDRPREARVLAMDAAKEKKGPVSEDTELDAEDLKALCERSSRRSFKKTIKARLFRTMPKEQLWGGIGAVFPSWKGKRAITYRKIEGIPDDWGTAVNVQAMVFGNMGDDSATGVRYPQPGDRRQQVLRRVPG